MSLLSWCRLNFQRYRTAWFVGGVFALLIVFAILWRSLYLLFLEEQVEQHRITESLIVKSGLIENLIISARNRSVLIAQMLFQKQRDNAHFDALMQRFTDEAVSVIANQQDYVRIADDDEKKLLNQHFELATMNRAQQDYLLDLLVEGERELAMHEYIESALPVQEQALALLDALHRHVAQQREINKRRIDEHSQTLTQIVYYSTSFYFLLLLALALFVVWRLIKSSRAQADLQTKLNNQLLEKTVAYEQADKELIRLARYDTVTDLFNRRYFEQCLQDSLAKSRQVALVLLDLDNFKWFNDTLGHAIGDELLRRFAQKLCDANSPIAGAPIGRLGGDEFAIILADTSPEEEEEVIRFLLASIADLNEHYGSAKTLNASIGIARFPDHAQETDLLMRFADLAMYQAKALGKGRAVVFNATLLQAMYDELDLEQALKQALQERQLQVFYQAQYR
ncbi:MAG: GGDEF domain-containing protein, partial [Gammaproteobacteria bacterium]|nr:GGDEF domain-containing protein [Gammaproteobacteria bacterium]